jgi:hypothetical protein
MSELEKYAVIVLVATLFAVLALWLGDDCDC